MEMMAATSLAVLCVCLILIVLWDAFEAFILPRRVDRKFRLTRFYYVKSWGWLTAIARRIPSGRRRERILGYFGPLSLIGLLIMWGLVMILAFATLQWSLGSRLAGPDKIVTFGSYLYMSGSTFFTLGYGDVTPLGMLGRLISIVEAGVGLGFLAIIIGYLPVVYGAFSRREINISLLDARAGSPPSSVELLLRHGRDGDLKALQQLLNEWERWSAELLESHLSYPVLTFFRSQHENQSWLTALTCILDVCSLCIVGFQGAPKWQAKMTFAMARHALVDLAQVLGTAPRPPEEDRLPPTDLALSRHLFQEAGLVFTCSTEGETRLHELRRMYEPYANAMCERLFVVLPPWLHRQGAIDNWQTSAWERNPEGFASNTTITRRKFDYVRQSYED